MPASKSSIETIISICALFLAVLGIVVSIYDGWQNRNYNRITQIPYIQLDRGFNSESGFWINYVNNGNGPAVIKWMRIYANGKEVETWNELIKESIGGTESPAFTFSIAWPGTFMRPVEEGKYRDLLRVTDRDAASKLWNQRSRMNVQMMFCSLYEDCYITWLGHPPQPVGADLASAKSKIRIQ